MRYILKEEKTRVVQTNFGNFTLQVKGPSLHSSSRSYFLCDTILLMTPIPLYIKKYMQLLPTIYESYSTY